jgi:hypothetical protein
MRHPELGDYLLRVNDDTIVSVPNLLALVDRLNDVFSPASELVLRAFAQGERPSARAGWLISRAFVVLHARQDFTLNWRAAVDSDDASEAPLIKRAIGGAAHWSDPRFMHFCLNYGGRRFIGGDFAMLTVYPAGAQTWPMNEVVTMRPKRDRDGIMAGLLIGRYPHALHYFFAGLSGDAVVCYLKTWRTYNRTVQIPVKHIALRNIE